MRPVTDTTRTKAVDTEAKRRAKGEAKARKTETARQALAVMVWNQDHPIGTPVSVRRDNREDLETRTRSKAELLGGHTAVVWLENVSGCYLLDRVTPRTP